MLNENVFYTNSQVVNRKPAPEEPLIEVDFRSVVASLVRNWKLKMTLSLLALFSWIPPLLITLIIISIMDFVAGVLASKARGEDFLPNKARRGIAVKLLLILLSTSGYIVHAALPQTIRAAIPDGANIGSFLSMWTVATEFFSIFRIVKDNYTFRGPVESVFAIISADAKPPIPPTPPTEPTNKP